MQNWLNDKIEINYRELFQILAEFGQTLSDSNNNVDIETLSFDTLMTLYQHNNDGELPYIKKEID